MGLEAWSGHALCFCLVHSLQLLCQKGPARWGLVVSFLCFFSCSFERLGLWHVSGLDALALHKKSHSGSLTFGILVIISCALGRRSKKIYFSRKLYAANRHDWDVHIPSAELIDQAVSTKICLVSVWDKRLVRIEDVFIEIFFDKVFQLFVSVNIVLMIAEKVF